MVGSSARIRNGLPHVAGEPIAPTCVIAQVPFQGASDGLTLIVMGALQQVLVVDDGHRAIDHSLAAELAELGYASVTVSLEAADDVLAVIARPAAILLQTSARRDPAFAKLSARLRERMRKAGIPVIVVDHLATGRSGTPIDLQSRIGPYVLNEPDL